MSSSKRVWSRALVGALLVALGTSVELYDQLPPNDDLLYQDGDDVDTEPVGREPRLPGVSDLMLKKILAALHMQAGNDRIPYRPNQIYDSSERHLKASGLQLKDPVLKRLVDSYAPLHLGLHHKQEPVSRPQQKWKIKKGKAIGSQMVCYFKLCAFRSPA